MFKLLSCHKMVTAVFQTSEGSFIPYSAHGTQKLFAMYSTFCNVQINQLFQLTMSFLRVLGSLFNSIVSLKQDMHLHVSHGLRLSCLVSSTRSIDIHVCTVAHICNAQIKISVHIY